MDAWLQPSNGATKAGIIGLSKSLAIEASRYGITVNAVCPGFIATGADKKTDRSRTNGRTRGSGSSVSLSSDGNTALIGAPGKNNNQGAGYVFQRPKAMPWLMLLLN
ncbi:MAG: SDR family oxidoreductase [Thermodesulfobacteriota bacterium]|jgi:NAD(P)-dependent dehydrogenase (short-subunit alcohol dehydrogenase family)